MFWSVFQGSDPIIEPRTEQTLKYWKEERKKGRKKGRKEGKKGRRKEGRTGIPVICLSPRTFFFIMKQRVGLSKIHPQLLAVVSSPHPFPNW